MEHTLYSVITIVIEAYFDDENEYGRLINMMDGKTFVESKELTASHLSTVESLQWTKEDLDETKCQLDETKNQLDETKCQLNEANDRISNLEAEVQRLKDMK